MRRRSPYRAARLHRPHRLRPRLRVERPVNTEVKSLHIRGNRVPKKRNTLFAKLRAHRHSEGRNLTLHARARLLMNARRSALRAKQWHGGKEYVGKRLHGGGGGWGHRTFTSHAKHKSAKTRSHRPLTAKQRAHLALLHKQYHFGKKVK